MFTRSDIPPLSIAAGSAAAAGLVLGLWLSLPSYLSRPIERTEPQLLGAVDPNLAKYREMIAAEGVSMTPYILATGYYPIPSSTVATLGPDDEMAAVDASIARAEAAFQAREAQAQARRVAWLDEQRETWRAQTYAYPAAYRAPVEETVREVRWSPEAIERPEPPRPAYEDAVVFEADPEATTSEPLR